MEDIESLWTFQESIDELKQRLQYMTYELEITKKEANEEKRKNNEQINKLLQVLQTAFKERDEAKSQLNKLQQSLSFDSDLTTFTLPPFSPDTPLICPNYPAKSNSGITDSNTNNNNNPHSPVVDSLSYPPPAQPTSPDSASLDRGNLVIQNLAKGRPLPPKGNLMEAVKMAGPLLETLLMAGSLPRWRNPPGLMTHPIPPVNIGSRSSVYGPNYFGSSSSNGYFGSSSMLDFGCGSSISKRQRLL